MDGESERGRSVSFRRLKPVCVALSKVTISGQTPATAELSRTLRDVLDALQQVHYLDSELANYVFFPLARVFSSIASLPSSVVDLSLRCLCVLIGRGWSKSADVALCKQLLVLLSFITDPSSVRGQGRGHYSDVVTASALECLRTLFHDASPLVLSLCHYQKESPLPVLGQAIGSILSCLNNDLGHDVENRAAATIRSLVKCLQFQESLNGFLPGVVSALIKYVTSTGGPRRSAKSIVDTLAALEVIICSAFSDRVGHQNQEETARTSQEWREEQIPQLNNAITQLIKVKDHENEAVRAAVYTFCISILRECQPALKICVNLCLATGIYLCVESGENFDNQRVKIIQEVIAANPEFVGELNQLLEEWLVALSRITLEGNLERLRKQGTMLVSGYRISNYVEGSSDQLKKMLLQSLQESAAIALTTMSARPPLLVEANGLPSKSMTVAIFKENTLEFKALGHSIKGQGGSLECLQVILHNLTEESNFFDYAIQYIPTSLSPLTVDTLPSMWLARSLLSSLTSGDNSISQFTNVYDDDSEERLSQIDGIYSQAVDILTTFDENVYENWRLQALSLEIIALTAKHHGQSFQPELVDVLFPVIERIGSVETEVRERALTCLNILARACGAASAGELIVQNADYLVNSMALKLNAFQISPQAPKVMVMVIHLCGPSIIPYLDDILESIFSALASYHGYPQLVDALFSILEAIVDQASSPSSKLLEAPAKTYQADHPQALPILQVRSELSRLKGLSDNPGDGDGANLSAYPGEIEPERDTQMENSKNDKNDPSKTYQMVQSIARHAQYYLTHSSPTLRQRLLKLMSVASRALSRNEDQYLPLINDVWPVVISRLYDPEATVVMEAMESLVVLFQCAGNFLLSRIQAEWPRIIRLGRNIKAKSEAENRGRGGRGAYSATYQMLERFVTMLSGLASHIGTTAEMEDDIFDVFSDLGQKPGVSRLLQQVNGDAYWLLQTRTHLNEGYMHTPTAFVPGLQFKAIAI